MLRCGQNAMIYMQADGVDGALWAESCRKNIINNGVCVLFGLFIYFYFEMQLSPEKICFLNYCL